MAAMSAAADRPLNWNLLQVYAQNWDFVQHQLAGYDYAAERGGTVIALTLPDSFRSGSTCAAASCSTSSGWDRLMALPDADKLAMLRDPAGGRRWTGWRSPPRARRGPSATGRATSCSRPSRTSTAGSRAARWAGHRQRARAHAVGHPGRHRGRRRAHDGHRQPGPGQDDASWARRVEVWRTRRAVVGASDAGAHLDMIDSFSFSTTLLARAVRERGLLPIEEAVHYLTASPARLYGLTDRGRLAVGAHADVVVFDPATIGPGPVHTRFDLPGGAGRIYGDAEGISHVLVNGAPRGGPPRGGHVATRWRPATSHRPRCCDCGPRTARRWLRSVCPGLTTPSLQWSSSTASPTGRAVARSTGS